jgi:hypothetical protein
MNAENPIGIRKIMKIKIVFEKWNCLNIDSFFDLQSFEAKHEMEMYDMQ